jgi:hypothetical protein
VRDVAREGGETPDRLAELAISEGAGLTRWAAVAMLRTSAELYWKPRRRRLEIDDRAAARDWNTRSTPHFSQLLESITPFGNVDKNAFRMPIEQVGRNGRGHCELRLRKISGIELNGGGGREFPLRRLFRPHPREKRIAGNTIETGGDG